MRRKRKRRGEWCIVCEEVRCRTGNVCAVCKRQSLRSKVRNSGPPHAYQEERIRRYQHAAALGLPLFAAGDTHPLDIL